MRSLLPLFCFLCFMVMQSCAPGRILYRSAKRLSKEGELKNAHLGISVYDVAGKKQLVSYQAEKYFIPASNTKIFTLYAGLKSLRDSLPGIRFRETADTVFILATGDPTLLHPDFKQQRVIEKLQLVRKPLVLLKAGQPVSPFGMGWAWDDYNSSYMAERSALPVYGNLIRWIQSAQTNTQQELGGSFQTFVFSVPDVNWKVRFIEDTANRTFHVKRRKDENYFEIHQGTEQLSEQSIPFVTNGIQSAIELLKDTIHIQVLTSSEMPQGRFETIFSQAADTLYQQMMHNSDNFFAEQLLLMSAEEKLGVMSQEKIIDQLLSSDLKGLPQRPNWVDGSGLSRYNLFTPADFVWVLNKMQDEFGLERMKTFFPTGDEGTLAGYYATEKGRIYAKTGTLSANLALSGFVITKKNRLLIFSILVNNHQSSAPSIRRKMESFIQGIINKY